MKKTIAILAVIALTVGMMSTTAFAHGHSRGVSATTAYGLCSAENCNTVGNHQHNGITYSGHNINDGHGYHQLCNINGCTETGSHQHNGTTHLPHTNGDGHTNHNTTSGHRTARH